MWCAASSHTSHLLLPTRERPIAVSRSADASGGARALSLTSLTQETLNNKSELNSAFTRLVLNRCFFFCLIRLHLASNLTFRSKKMTVSGLVWPHIGLWACQSTSHWQPQTSPQLYVTCCLFNENISEKKKKNYKSFILFLSLEVILSLRSKTVSLY